MANVTWVNNADGDWANGSNWSAGVLPGSTDNVTINTPSLHTIGFATTAAVSSLYTGYNSQLKVASGTLTVLSYASLNGALTQTGGRIAFAGSDSTLVGGFTQTAGTLAVVSGSVTLQGTADSIGGVVTGAGELVLSYGTHTVQAGASLSVGAVSVTSGTLNFAQDIAYAGAFSSSSGVLNLGGHTLSLSGAVGLSSSNVTGGGTLALSGLTEIYSEYIAGGVQAINSGTVNQTANLQLGTIGTDTASLVNAAGGLYALRYGADIGGYVNESVSNAGSLVVSGTGTSTIGVKFVNTGTASILAGTMQLSGTANVLGGRIDGPGRLELTYGSDQFAAGLTLAVGSILHDGAALSLGANTSFAGSYAQTAGTLALSGKTLSLTGAVNLDGGSVAGTGTLAVSGTTEMQGYYLLGTVILANSGTVNQTANIGDGYYAGDATKLNNLAGATWLIRNAADISGQVGSVFNNTGSLLVTAGGGTTVIAPRMSSTGVITVASGVLQLNGAGSTLAGTIDGGGLLQFYYGSYAFKQGLQLTVANVQLTTNAVVTLGGGLTYSGNWAQVSGTLALGGKYLSLSGDAALLGGVVNGAGTLNLQNSAQVSGMYFEGSADLRNSRSANQTGSFYLGYNAGDTARLDNLAGAKWNIYGDSYIRGVVGSQIVNAGTLTSFGAGVTTVQVSTMSTTSVVVRSGTLQFQGNGNSFAGSVSGAGTLDLYYGTDTFAAGLTLATGAVILDYSAALTLGGSLAYAGSWTQSSGTLALGGNTLSLSGVANLDGGIANGSGTIALAGNTQVGAYYLEGSLVLRNTGVVHQTTAFRIGYNAGDTASVVNAAGATWLNESGGTTYGVAASSFTNAGKLGFSSSGLSDFGAQLLTTGAVSIESGTLRLQGNASSLGGAILGGGTLDFYYGSDLLAAGLNLTVAAVVVDYAAVVTLGANLAYAGAWTQTSGTVALGGHTLSLAAAAALDAGNIAGSGTIALTAGGEIGATYLLGSVVLSNTGTLVAATGFHVGYNAGDTAKLVNTAGATVVLENGSRVYGLASSTFSNAGTVQVTGTGIAYVDTAFINTGNVLVGSHTMQFQSPVTGSGKFDVGAGGTLSFEASVASGSQVSLGAGATLQLDQPTTFAGTVSQFVLGDVIDFAGFGTASTSFSFNSATNKLTVTNGSSSAVVGFTAGHTAGEFRSFDDRGIFAIAHT